MRVVFEARYRFAKVGYYYHGLLGIDAMAEVAFRLELHAV
jgi:hypothetical protein